MPQIILENITSLTAYLMFYNVKFCQLLKITFLQSWLLWVVQCISRHQSCQTLCDPIDGSPTGSPIPGILQARTPEGVAISFSSAWKWKVKGEVAQSCPTLSDPMDCSLPGSSIHGIFQARVLEWVAITFCIFEVKVHEIKLWYM